MLIVLVVIAWKAILGLTPVSATGQKAFNLLTLIAIILWVLALFNVIKVAR